MKVYIKNKVFSLGGGSKVLDENQQPIYKVKGRVFSITRVKKIYDMQDNLLYKVRNKWFNWFVHKAYIYDANKNKIATVKDKWLSFKGEFFIEGYQDEIKIGGKFFALTSEILRNGEVIATIRRQMFSIKDSFELDAKNDEDVPFLIALVIAIDNICDNRSKIIG